MSRIAKILAIGIIATLALPGCGSSLFNAHIKDAEIARGMAADTVKKLGDSGVGQYSGSAQGINPGLRVSAGIEYFAVARYEGLAGQFSASGHGQLNGDVSVEDQALIRAIWNDTALNQEQKRAAVIEILKGIVLKQPAEMQDDPRADEQN